MEAPPWDYYDLGLWSLGETFPEVQIRSDSVQDAVPEADEEAHAEERVLCLMNNVHQEGDINYKADQEDDNGQEGDIGHEGGRGDQEPGQQLAAMAQLAPAAGLQHENPKPRMPPRKFTPVQVEELENMYKHTAYPDRITRRDLARCIGDTEARVKAWFKNRRAKDSRNERLAMLRNAPPATLNHLGFKVLQKP